VGGNPEVVEEGRSGLLFPPGDAAGLSEHLDRLILDGELWGRLGRAARDRVVTQFSLRAMMENYRNLYLEAAGRRGLRAGR
jgi:glycosyltransferase involved in cell wall biosynthesis